ncbi:DUF3784 domain-containing protein [Psychroflexus tropicus]|uniref:DUF3784 domain-containing protein n=1 Tax=Psychroflexus tropicus TaxID=197345 RepID=UPI000364EBFE|nr:DUF3784 domain-containing protein [Psychroflexus tropicus]
MFILIGVFIKYGEMYTLMAGYNTMSKEEQKQFDVEALAKLMKNVMFGMALVVIAGLLLSNWTENSDYEFYALGLALLVGIPYLLVQGNSDRYKKDKNNGQ